MKASTLTKAVALLAGVFIFLSNLLILLHSSNTIAFKYQQDAKATSNIGNVTIRDKKESGDPRLDQLFLVNDTKAKYAGSSSSKLSQHNKYRLELLHISKNAGTIIEIVAMQHNITWGACHFHFRWKNNENNPMKNCPKNSLAVEEEFKNSMNDQLAHWHYPLDLLDYTGLPMNYTYDNLQDKELRERPKKFFIVIRNPYDRLLGVHQGQYKGDLCGQLSPRRLNDHIQRILQLKPGSSESMLYRPASHYIYKLDETEILLNTTRVIDSHKELRVDHILRFENLHEEFDLLMGLYNMSHTMMLPKERFRGARCPNYMTVKNFTKKTIQLINEAYADDFIIGDYPKEEV